jgi:uncharacterized protein YjiS (DUF1127 family)
MDDNVPVLPIAGATVVRAFLAVLSIVKQRLKAYGRARRHRREATALAGLDCHMLADIGISRADLRDAFSEPFWEDPTMLLRERVIDRRLNLTTLRVPHDRVECGFGRPSTDWLVGHPI